MDTINMKFLISSLVVISQLSVGVLGDIPRPRGVSISEAALYSQEDFGCFDSDLRISRDRINDDFCDCADGSDEPGTSACPNGQFYCENAGFFAKRLPSSRVNDGICDCCDGSDEYKTDVVCVNNCFELARAQRERDRVVGEIWKQGGHLRTEMSTKGKISKAEKTTRLDEIERSIQQAAILKTERETFKLNVESEEKVALDVYRKLAEEEKQLREEAEALDRERFEQEQQELQEQQQEQQEQQAQPDSDDYIDGVTEVPLASDAGYGGEADDMANVDDGIQTAPIYAEPDFEDMADLQNEEETFDEEEEETGEGHVEHVEHVETQYEYDEPTRKLIEMANEARSQFETAERELRQLESEKRQLEEQLGKDHGVDEEFAVLNGECFNFEDREYVYKLCPFDRVIQQPKNGGGETR